MRVAIIIPRLDQLGPVKVIQSLVNSLDTATELQIKIFYLDKTVDPRIRMNVPAELLVRRRFCFQEYDIIHTNGIRPDLFAFLNHKKINYHISTIHNFVFDDLSFTYNKLFSWVFGNIWLLIWKRADKLVCLSETMKNYYLKWFSASKLEVIHNGISEIENSFILEDDIIHEITGLKARGLKLIGSAGILNKRKGYDQVFLALSEAKEFALIIFGNGNELSELQTLAKKMNLSNRCVFCGFKSYAVKYFQYLDFFVAPSRSEGFGLALVEAVQQKIPVICSDIEVFKELFNEEEVTFFRLNDTISLIQALYKCQKNGIMKAELAYRRYLNNYTNKLMAKRYYELYRLVC